jgi:hypothetical protein
MKIALGSLVLCKILVLNPVQKEAPRGDGLRNYNQSSTNMTAQKLNDSISGQNSNNKGSKYSYDEKFITGVVQEVQSRRKLVEVEKNKKYQYKDFHSLLIKTDDLEKLLIKAESCALSSDVIDDGSGNFKKKSIEKKTVKKDPIESKSLKKEINEETIDMSNFTQITDEETLKKYSKYIELHKKKYYEGNNKLGVVDFNNKIQKNEIKKLSNEELGSIAKDVLNYSDKMAEQEKNPVKSFELNKEIEQKLIPIKDKVVEVLDDKKNIVDTKGDSLFNFLESQKKNEKKVKKNVNFKNKNKIAFKNKEKKLKQKKIQLEKDIASKELYKNNPNIILEAIKLIIFE